MDFVGSFVGVLLGGIVTVVVTVWVERLRSPLLSFSIEPPIDLEHSRPASDGCDRTAATGRPARSHRGGAEPHQRQPRWHRGGLPAP
jgi:hypothetical protein